MCYSTTRTKMTKHNSVGRCFRRIHTGILVRGGREERGMGNEY
ncbi:hypothetical protein CLOBOL_01717 [Enterocloster bolteae ATCC BAA-613]|uniref:Uncharacterized protein n=1 Tax=Enterocloster bolteae (strain ATCC BAA-613 / DSM 15670 / CCUG 46953 / JCM 12243 / WAL 16351) TaxID=411902 RepID=A8RLR9_ENTBW|nr:hypothetical protein CLOBOL_01717 [Enterocloster bolteae ATCC BAA-613]